MDVIGLIDWIERSSFDGQNWKILAYFPGRCRPEIFGHGYFQVNA